MLKNISKLFLGLVVCAGSACVTPTHASSAQTVILTSIQAGGASGAKEELLVLYNSSSQSADITDMCMVNKANIAFACFASDATEGEVSTYTLAPYGYLTIASQEYVVAHIYAYDFYSLVYAVTNQSSGSIVGSADSLSFIDADQATYATKSWSTSLASGKALARIKLITEPDIYAINNDTADWVIENAATPPRSGLDVTTTPVQVEEPGEGEGGDGEGEGTAGNPQAPTHLPPVITELLPNPSGSDTNGEYIELYNPNITTPLLLNAFSLKVGIDAPKWYIFPENTTIEPQSYRAFTNTELGFTLVNTMGRVQLVQGIMEISESIEYTSPKDDQAWALIGGTWQYTTRATPGAANEPTPEAGGVIEDTAAEEVVAVPKPCASNQYRNPETGRCKLIGSATSAPTPCKAGQERSPETNRCRSIVSATTSPAPCKEGQERNPETNRCRNIVKMSDATYKVKGVQTVADNQPRWYYWFAIVVVVMLVAGYAVWEWREELRMAGNRLWRLVRK